MQGTHTAFLYLFFSGVHIFPLYEEETSRKCAMGKVDVCIMGVKVQKRTPNSLLRELINVLFVVSRLWPARPADSQLRRITSTICHIYTFYLLMMGC
jgi:hypothetical protein